MEYKIINNKGEVIAEFRFEHDRDVCFDLLDEDKDMSRNFAQKISEL